jgi:hypothetical protein
MSDEARDEIGHLTPQYQYYQRQKCFIAYSERAEWAADLLSACEEVLTRPEFNLEPDHARKHFNSDVPLRQKALELITNARYGIYDLSSWQDENGEWQIPRNVFIEMGMAIALNRPMLLLRHACNQSQELPECLKSISHNMLQFSGYTTLKRVLVERLPQWIQAPPEQDWKSRYCIFGGRTCEYREIHPRMRQWGQSSLNCHISDGSDIDRPDFRAVVEEVLERYSDITFDYLDNLRPTTGYNFLLCSHCQTVRSSPFAIYRITAQTSAETFLSIGMSLALESQFEYKIPKVLLVDNKQDVPSLLEGYEVILARSDRERKKYLRNFIPMVMAKARECTWKPQVLPFVNVILDEHYSPEYKESTDEIVTGTQQRFSIFYTDSTGTKAVPAELPNDVSMRRLVPALVSRIGLPTTDEKGQPLSYALWYQGTPIDAEQSLRDVVPPKHDESIELRADADPSRIPSVPVPSSVTGTRQQVRISYTDNTSTKTVPVGMPNDVEMHRLVPALVRRIGLPTTDEKGQPLSYALWYQGVPIGAEQALRDVVPLKHDEDLELREYLQQNDIPLSSEVQPQLNTVSQKPVKISAAEEVICPFCGVIIDKHVCESVVVCPSCDTPHHLACWAANGDRCTTPGCEGSGDAKKLARTII